MEEKKRIGVLTGGGDCPGLNAVIRAVVKKAYTEGFEPVGFKDGWKGPLLLWETSPEGQMLPLVIDPLMPEHISGIIEKGGTILGSSRTNPADEEKGLERVIKNLEKLKIDSFISIGGEDTLSVAVKLSVMGVKIVGVPKTIDNDVGGTEACIGFHTAVQTAMEAIDKIRDTAESHHQIMIIEVMGRHFGWIATFAGLAAGADFILIPEESFNLGRLLKSIEKRRAQGKRFSLIVISEGVNLGEGLAIAKEKLDAFGHKKLGGVGQRLAEILEEKTGSETKAENFGRLSRGGSPTAFDRILATRFGVKAVELIKKGKFGRMVAFRNGKIVDVALEKALCQRKVDHDVWKCAKLFFS